MISVLCFTALAAAGTTWAQSWKPSTNAEFELLKSTLGAWIARYPDGSTVEIDVKLISSGSALMETMRIGKVEMVTIFHPYGEHLMATHYCASNTQPRLVTRKPGPPGNELHFEFLDATNMMSANAMAISSLVMRFKDKDHFQEEWRSPAPKQPPTIMNYERRPMVYDAPTKNGGQTK